VKVMKDTSASAWRCSVCGYVHRGPAPPDFCPVCGAADSDFEAYAEEERAPAKEKTERWRCLNCNYAHLGPQPPEECPVCGARKDRFEPVAETRGEERKTGKGMHVVIVGGGIAGISAAESIRSVSQEARITLISKESSLPYYRLNLTRYLAGEIDPGTLPIHDRNWYQENDVELMSEVEVSALVLDDGKVELRDGSHVPFESLILTVGAHPFIPPFPGTEREGVMSLRTLGDAECILEAAQPGTACVCVGGGILGIETAGALARRGANVALLEGHPWLMPRQLNAKAGQLLRAHIEGLGVEVRMPAQTKEFVGDERVAGVLLADETTLPADLVIITTGIRPNSHLARRAGLEVSNGIVVDNRLRSSHPQVFAAGDVAEHRGTLYGTWLPSQYQGNIAGLNAVGSEAEFGGIPRSNTLKVLGIDLWSIGQFEPEDGSYRVIEGEDDRRYRRFVFRDGLLVGSILLGDTSITGALKKAIEGRIDLSGLLRKGPSAADVADHFAAMTS
jgi:nitrite reductase (NADH) large subunit